LRPCEPNDTACQLQQQQQQAATQNLLNSIGGSASSVTDIFSNKYPTFRVGVQFNLPLFGDKTARAQLGRSLVEGERLDVQREQIEQNIQVDVRNALQTLRTAEARLRAAAIARENSVKQYESEQRKLDNGQSDIYRVLERQTALTAARSAELRSQTELNKAISDLQRATGNSLKANNVEARLR
jgi:HAE1 family hydrophobic/amphiphilic exporter-1